MTGTPATEAGIELHHVDPVPESHRQGRPRDLFHVWFASDLNVGNAIFGAIIHPCDHDSPRGRRIRRCTRRAMAGLYDDPMRRPATDPYWNTNVARHPGILRAVPERCGDALDVGCGDGLLARKLAGRAKHVTGIDMSPDMIACAREFAAGDPQLTFVEGDFLAAELPGAQYDFVCSVTTIHHMDFEAALVRMRDLLRPGGTLVVVGLAREVSVTEWAALIAAAPIVRITKVLRRASAPQGMPVADPQMSYGQVRAAARLLLPGVRYRRHVLRRYSLTWEKPAH